MGLMRLSRNNFQNLEPSTPSISGVVVDDKSAGRDTAFYTALSYYLLVVIFIPIAVAAGLSPLTLNSSGQLLDFILRIVLESVLVLPYSWWLFALTENGVRKSLLVTWILNSEFLQKVGNLSLYIYALQWPTAMYFFLLLEGPSIFDHILQPSQYPAWYVVPPFVATLLLAWVAEYLLEALRHAVIGHFFPVHPCSDNIQQNSALTACLLEDGGFSDDEQQEECKELWGDSSKQQVEEASF